MSAASAGKPDDKTKKETKEEVFERLESTAKGLSAQEAENRIAKYGYNELEEKKASPILKFLSYFWGPIPWMIEAAAILSVFVGDLTDFIIIMVLLIANALVGFVEEYSADNTVAALKDKLALKAKAKRDGNWIAVQARELVPGDVVRIRLGDIVPADAFIFEGETAKIDQAALTGESLPVDKGPGDTVYSGSVMKQGEVDSVVTGTGKDTFFGKTAALIAQTQTTSHFQKAVLKIGNVLIVMAILLVLIILTVSLFRGDKFLEILQFCLVLTIASVPVAMPTVLSITMAVGAKLLTRKKAIVRKLAAIEELAGVDILVSDKTGTLTQNKLSLNIPFLNGKTTEDEIVLYAALASRAEDQDPIDLTVINGVKDKKLIQGFEVLHFHPFDPVTKRTEALIRKDGKKFKVSKGAPQVILALAKNRDEIADKVNQAINDFAEKGFRSLGVARTNEKEDWELLGILPLFDPPREDSMATIEAAKKIGVAIKMATGDQMAIAKQTASELGLGNTVMDAQVLSGTSGHEHAQTDDRIEHTDVFAEVFPEHKYRIVDVLQKKDHIVAMTGDGVNDSPALKKADVGIAVEGATDAAQSAADIVLTSPGLSVIIDAIKESRKTFQRMNSYIIYRITETIRLIFFMALSILVFNFYPVTAIMIVLLALLNDGAIISIAYDNTYSSDRPEAWDMKTVFSVAITLGSVGVFETFGLYYVGDRVFGLSKEMLQTMIFLKLMVSGHLTVFVARTRGPFWSSRPSGILLVAVVVTKVIATILAAYGLLMPAALGWKYVGLIWAYCLVWFIIEDITKLAVYKILESEHAHSVYFGRARGIF
jgi:H+-transporting ATPase